MNQSSSHSKINKGKIQQAIDALKQGGLVLIPTETVYGIAVDATNKNAIEKIYQVKKRLHDKPLQIMCSSFLKAQEIAYFDGFSAKLCEENWPGSLTAIVKMNPNAKIADNFNIIDDSIGIRIPDYELTLELLENCGFPLAVSSANISNNSAVAKIDEVSQDIILEMDYILENFEVDKRSSGIASTVVDFRVLPPKVLRQGGLFFDF